ncbi:nipsnap family containing protein [Enterobacter roggenkampii]|nr:nipsnap family containing protein [Enterobacter roggenkampii]
MAAALNAFYASDDWHSGPRENIVGSIETSIKTVMNLPTKNVEGLRVQS